MQVNDFELWNEQKNCLQMITLVGENSKKIQNKMAVLPQTCEGNNHIITFWYWSHVAVGIWIIAQFKMPHIIHCVKSVHIWSLAGPNARKHGTEKLRFYTVYEIKWLL